MSSKVESLSIDLPSGSTVSGLLLRPADPIGCFVFAHGAGAGMHQSFMAHLALAMSQRRIATLRFQFPYMESGCKVPDGPEVAGEAIREAVAHAARHCPDLPLFAGGKSHGGRMTSQAQAAQALHQVAGLIFFGVPLHAADKPATGRAKHLSGVRIPMLFFQGDRDVQADTELMRTTVAHFGPAATLHVVAGADHGFHVLAGSGRSNADVIGELADVTARWASDVLRKVR
ncbi:MAG TPA: alpha/beta family hydrolase [Ramlibacter sp.]|nr:alpha/beta family hydrolase [Ramlibacter sp.]